MSCISVQAAIDEILARPGVASVMAALNADGEEARLIGGAVRNAMLGVPVADIDIATTSLPENTLKRAQKAGIHAVPTGFEHGTVTLVVGGVPHEITTLRQDIATDGRRATVQFGRDFQADAKRRDFTINALSVDATGKIHDYVGGVADLNAHRVRFIGNADQRIKEDYLRILRFFRFSAVYANGQLDSEGLAAAQRHKSGLGQLSRERIRAEMLKVMIAPHALPVLQEMATCGVLDEVIGSSHDVQQLAAMAELESQNVKPPDAIRRLAALTVRNEADIDRLRDTLRLTNREVGRLTAMIAPGPSDQKLLLYRLGADAYRDRTLLRGARTGEDISLALALPEEWTPPTFLLSGKDVIALGIPKGPKVGSLLQQAEAAWLAAGLPAEEDAQHDILRRVVSRQN